MKNKTVCVYASSSDAVQNSYIALAELLGTKLAQRGFNLVYGAGSVGLMGACARSFLSGEGSIIGVIPEALKLEGILFEGCQELYVTKTMRERKQMMEEKADAFIALPGGFGTLEELLEMITLKQLGYHEKPIVILNGYGFFEPLLRFFDKIYEERFAKMNQDLFHVSDQVEEALNYIQDYVPSTIERKWF